MEYDQKTSFIEVDLCLSSCIIFLASSDSMNWSGIRVLILEGNPREKACVSLLSFSARMGCCSISADKRQVCGEWKRLGGKLTGDIMKIYVGIDMANDKFDYCAMDDTLNILCSGSN